MAKLAESPRVAIVDHGLGNLFSVRHACNKVGLDAEITFSKKDILHSDAVILPGVGAFGDAMQSLRKLDLVETLQETALTKPFIGICLGMQLLMSESCEFEKHLGLGIIPGSVLHFGSPVEQDGSGAQLKVPQIGWNSIYKAENSDTVLWQDTALDGLSNNEFMYFVHSFYVRPEDPEVILSYTKYGNIEFCSSLKFRNIFACQFHPERSGTQGLKIYKNLLSFFTS
jgi:glutamine amidotransferase